MKLRVQGQHDKEASANHPRPWVMGVLKLEMEIHPDSRPEKAKLASVIEYPGKGFKNVALVFLFQFFSHNLPRTSLVFEQSLFAPAF